MEEDASIFWHLVDGDLKTEGSLPLLECSNFLGMAPQGGFVWLEEDENIWQRKICGTDAERTAEKDARGK